MTSFTVNILLSSYNGRAFIREQIESLLAQTYENIVIHIRDDGSTDDTAAIVQSYLSTNNHIHLITGSNIGVVASFTELLKQAPKSEYNLYAFCDQDDIWLPDKIERAVTLLSKQARPDNSLYCSRLEYVNEKLGHLGYSPIPKATGFRNAIVENVAIGCTSVFGAEVREKILIASPTNMIMHDWWAYLTASSFGEVVFDKKPTILYRQHVNSVTEFEPRLNKIIARFRSFISRLFTNQHKGLDSLNQAIHFKNTYKDLPDEYAKIIDYLIGLRKSHTLFDRIKYIYKTDVRRTNSVENWALKAVILLGLH